MELFVSLLALAVAISAALYCRAVRKDIADMVEIASAPTPAKQPDPHRTMGDP